jgi:hypothetical protein
MVSVSVSCYVDEAGWSDIEDGVRFKWGWGDRLDITYDPFPSWGYVFYDVFVLERCESVVMDCDFDLLPVSF